ncbi:Retrovirus-related Pol polyprotein from transposon TNT 1-94 [Gossypium australe]|uniref:Retrovirus-related Pol polyprotein from transposon TNT 1-94 n=1 Tax=Gossypium australe TaxID=47621 RepID=A0A5B6VDL1_9ROSI|nr:Retrovirus-related Pol polyprotein from transposon TNT 1-94 [Gossypium australe]
MVDRQKARLVAKGCSQVLGCDFKETFSQVVKPATIRTILSIAVTNGWQLRQFDVNSAFLNGDFTDEVLYSNLQAMFNMGQMFLICNGFVLAKSDASLFVKVATKSIVYVLIYMDDIIITGSSTDLHNEFSLKDLGDLHYFLGVEFSRSSTGSLHLCSLANAKSVHTRMVSSSTLSKDEGTRLADPTEYRSFTGALQYVVLTRLDIVYTVNRVCQFMHAPITVHMVALKCILRYLHGTISYGLGLDFDDRRSTTGYCVYFGHTPVSWCFKKQKVVFCSTAEAKYRSLAAATSDVAWLVSLLTELRVGSTDTPTIWCDNSSAVAVTANPVASGSLMVGEVPACD